MLTEQQFSKLYRQYYARSYRFVCLYVHNDLAAEDIVSEALIKLWETLRTETIENPLAFLITILKNKSLDFLRTEERKTKAINSLVDWQERELAIRIDNLEACNPNTLFTDEIKSLLNKALETLPKNTRTAFIQSHLNGKPLKEISEELGITVKGVDYHISIAKKVLRIALKDYMPLFITIGLNRWFCFF